MKFLSCLPLILKGFDDRLELWHEAFGEKLTLARGLRIHLCPGRAQKDFGKLLRAVRAVCGGFTEPFRKLRLGFDKSRHQFTEGTKVATLFCHQRS